MSERDIERVLDIERAAYDFPWSGAIFSECMNAGYICRVCWDNAALVGYGIMSIGAGECHVMNLCVDPEQHGNGYGSLLMTDLLAIARRSHAQIAFLEVRISNQRAHLLYRHLGFNEVGIRRNYYPARKGREDAYVLARTLD
ncbi:MAG: ribosomal protein S18-alanine N-acetyltransferase [Arenicellales bacterium]